MLKKELLLMCLTVLTSTTLFPASSSNPPITFTVRNNLGRTATVSILAINNPGAVPIDRVINDNGHSDIVLPQAGFYRLLVVDNAGNRVANTINVLGTTTFTLLPGIFEPPSDSDEEQDTDSDEEQDNDDDNPNNLGG